MYYITEIINDDYHVFSSSNHQFEKYMPVTLSYNDDCIVIVL